LIRCSHSEIKITKQLKTGTSQKANAILHMLLPEDGEMDLGDQLLHLAKKLQSELL
jgi:16S rRNA (guanine1516-N2)-methyltransferase